MVVRPAEEGKILTCRVKILQQMQWSTYRQPAFPAAAPGADQLPHRPNLIR
jgi:hypothetical protein